MTDDEKLESEYIFGKEAEKVITNKAYQFATTSVKGQIIDKLANAEFMGDNGDILELVRKLQSMNALESELELIMQSGVFSENTMIDKQQNPNRYKRC